MIKLDGLEGLEFKHGVNDCYSVMRSFYAMNFDLHFPDWARPDSWWEPDAEGKHLNLYLDNFHELGFVLFDGHPRDRLPGDVILMAIRSPVANHGAVLLPDGKILHHLVGQRSIVESYQRPLYRDTTVAVLRHPKVDGNKLLTESMVDAWDLIPQRIRDQIAEYREQAQPLPAPGTPGASTDA